MNHQHTKSLSTFAAILVIFKIALAQDPLRNVLTAGFEDMAVIKQKAEAGDAAAQVTLAGALASHFHATEALQWYRKAAAKGNVDAKYNIGNMLLFGGPGIPNSLAVQPNQAEGIQWTFAAATNFHAYACWNMAKALRQGLGTGTNLIEAYAWLSLFANTSVVGRVEMNELALKLDGHALQEAQRLAQQFKSGIWPHPITRAIPEGDTRLKLSGITLGKTPLAMINGKTLSEGESANITLKTGTLRMKLLKIEKDYVQIAIEGENAPRLLPLK